MRKITLCRCFPLLLLLVILLLPTVVMARDGIASIRRVAGVVEILAKGRIPAIAALPGARLNVGDFVRTKSGGYAELLYDDGTILKIAQRSRVDIGLGPGGQGEGQARLVRGKVEAVVTPAGTAAGAGAKARRFEIHTPNAVAGVRGTDFIVTYERLVTGILVKKGNVFTYNQLNPDKVVILTPATLTSVTAGSPPLPPRPVSAGEVERMERGLSDSVTQSQTVSDAGTPAPTPSTGGEGGVSAASGDTIPTAISLPPLVTTAGGTVSQVLAASSDVIAAGDSQSQGGGETSTATTAPPPEVPLQNSTNVSVDIGFPAITTPPPLPVTTNVSVGVVFPVPPPPPVPSTTDINVDVRF